MCACVYVFTFSGFFFNFPVSKQREKEDVELDGWRESVRRQEKRNNCLSKGRCFLLISCAEEFDNMIFIDCESHNVGIFLFLLVVL